MFVIDTGAGRVALVPPFLPLPPYEPWDDCLKRTLDRPRFIGVILLRLGHYALAVVNNGGIVASKAGSRYVHGRHRAGGQSQRRWERNREQWIEKLFDEVCKHWETVSRPYADHLDALVIGGDRIVLGRFFRHCPEIEMLRDRLETRRVPVERPGQDALHEAAEAAWSSVVMREPG